MFSNASIRPVVANKPHIVYREGYWRVSPIAKPYHQNRQKFDAAHAFINKLNPVAPR